MFNLRFLQPRLVASLAEKAYKNTYFFSIMQIFRHKLFIFLPEHECLRTLEDNMCAI